MTKIPKKITFFWGNETMSWLRYMTLYSFCKYNPDWDVILIVRNCTYNKIKKWRSSELLDEEITKDFLPKVLELGVKIKEFDYSFVENIDKTMSNVHISDFLAWKILSTTGGVIADMDILFTKSLDPLIDKMNTEAADVGLICFQIKADNAEVRIGYVPVSFMVSSPDNAFFADVFLFAKKDYNSHIYQSAGSSVIMNRFNPVFQHIKIQYPYLNFYVLSDILVFPFSTYSNLSFADIIQTIFCKVHTNFSKDTVGVHWYANNRIAHAFNHCITETNYTNSRFKNTITHLLRGIL